MPLVKWIWGLIQSLVVLGVLALAVDYYDPTIISVEIPDYIRQLVLLGVVGVSIFWAVLHAVGGGLLGLAASGVGDGIKMGLILGLGLGFSRLWPHTLAWGIGCYLAQGPMWHMVGLGVASVVLLVLNNAMKYFWGAIQNGTMS